MDSDLIVALIAAAVALLTAGFTAVTTTRRNTSDREFRARTEAELEGLRAAQAAAVREEDRALKARKIIDDYRKPLLQSCVQLAQRIENIRYRGFLIYLKDDHPHRIEVASKSVLYRFASYMGWRELLARELTYLDYENGEQTRAVLRQLDNVRARLASSRLDVDNGKPRFMLWTEEQRAIGGLMLRTDGVGVIGFETFFSRYEDTFALWLEPFASDLMSPDAAHSERLGEVATALDELIRTLDEGGVYGHYPENDGVWRRIHPPVV